MEESDNILYIIYSSLTVFSTTTDCHHSLKQSIASSLLPIYAQPINNHHQQQHQPTSLAAISLYTSIYSQFSKGKKAEIKIQLGDPPCGIILIVFYLHSIAIVFVDIV